MHGSGESAGEAAPDDRRTRLLLEHISDTVSILDAEGRLQGVSGQTRGVLGYPPDWWEQRSAFDLAHPDDLPAAHELFDQLLASAPGSEHTAELRARHADGSWQILDLHGVNLFEDPDVRGLVITSRNVTARRRAETLLASQAHALELVARNAELERCLAAALQVSTDQRPDAAGAVLVTDATGSLRVVASGAAPAPFLRAVDGRRLGAGSAWALELGAGRSVETLDLAAQDHGMPGAAELVAAGATAMWSAPLGAPFGIDRAADADGAPGPAHEVTGVVVVALRETPLLDDDVAGATVRLASLAIDRSQAQARLAHQALHDELTGLPNRTLLFERLQGALGRRTPEEPTVAVLFLDVDRFKVINDSLGHNAGDQLLVTVAARLREAVRPEDTVARFGGDEFVVVLGGVRSLDEVHGVAGRVEAALRAPFRLGESEVVLTCSIGIALGNGRSDTPDVVLRNADTAMYRAKDRGRDRIEVFDDELRARAVSRLLFENDLRRALRRDELVVHYQPSVELATGRVNGLEALVRWDHPRRGIVGPAAFVELAAETGLIVPLGRLVLEQAVADAVRWRADHPGLPDELLLSVNISARQLSDPDLPDTVVAVLDAHGWPAASLALELTETELLDDAGATLDALQALAATGVRLSMDDFGTGYSSLSYLHRFPMDIVKIDRSFVASIGVEPSGVAIATGVISMAHALGQVANAEGIETVEQAEVLRSLGCDWGQGFLFAEPLDAAGISMLLAGDRVLSGEGA